MDLEETGKLALITGAAKRIGKALTEHLASAGWDIAIHCNRSELKAVTLADKLSDLYPAQRFQVFRADLSNPSETEKLFPRVIDQMGRPFLLINNASVFEPSSIQETTSLFLKRQFQVNFNAPFLLIHDFALFCGKGLVINLVDTRITGNKPDFAAYTLAKKALWELTKMAAVEMGPDIRVNAIAPGLTLPPEDRDEAYLCRMAAQIPMKRSGGLQPLLVSLDFIIKNDYLTGQLLFCDGGQNL